MDIVGANEVEIIEGIDEGIQFDGKVEGIADVGSVDKIIDEDGRADEGEADDIDNDVEGLDDVGEADDGLVDAGINEEILEYVLLSSSQKRNLQTNVNQYCQQA